MTETDGDATSSDAKSTPVLGAWIGGLTLLAVGGLLLAQQLGLEVSGSLWGGLLLIPGLGTAVASYRLYRAKGATPAAVSEAILAIFFLALAATIISGFDLNLLWPILLIGLAISLIVRSVIRRA